MDEIQNAVFLKRPKLRELYEKEKDTLLVSYLSDGLNKNRQVSRIFIDIFKDEVQKIFKDNSLLEKIEDYFSKTNYISTVDHHGILSHPSFFQAHLVQALANEKKDLKIIPVLSSGSISLDNHTFPRGLIFQCQKGERRVALVGARHRNECVLGTRLSSKENIEISLSRIKKDMPLSVFNILSRVIFKNISEKSFSSYASLTNRVLFSSLPNFGNLDLVMIPHEKISARIILESKDIQDLFFRDDFILKYEIEYKNIVGAHSSDGLHGTFLFWRMFDGRREKIQYIDGLLKNNDASFSIKYSRENILPLLSLGEIIPCMAVSYTLLGNFGLSLGGGFNQIDYLSTIYTAGTEVFPSFYFELENIMGGDFIYTGVKNSQNIFPASYLDILKNFSTNNVEDFVKNVERVTLGDAVFGVLRDAYYTDTKKIILINHAPPIIFQ